MYMTLTFSSLSVQQVTREKKRREGDGREEKNEKNVVKNGTNETNNESIPVERKERHQKRRKMVR